MKQMEYKDVIIRPRTITFEEFHENEINEYMERFKKEKDSPYYIGDVYKQSAEEYRKSLETWAGSERAYWDRQTHWFVNFPNGRVVRIPKRKYSEFYEQFLARVDKVIAKVEKENTTELGRFAAMMQKIIDTKIRQHSYLIYPTTYGIGLWAIYNFNFDRDREIIEGVLNDMGVEYYNEYSDAAWAYRFKISKKEANRALIASQTK